MSDAPHNRRFPYVLGIFFLAIAVAFLIFAIQLGIGMRRLATASAVAPNAHHIDGGAQ